MTQKLDSFVDKWARSRIMSSRNFQYACSAGGIFAMIFAFAAVGASGFLPPIPPSWDAEQTAQHYRAHEKGVQVGAMLLLVAGMFYLALTAVVAAQMRCIPNLHPAVSNLQEIAGTAGACVAFMLPGLILAVASYRLDRHVDVTQALNDLFWFTLLMSWPPLLAQGFAFAYAIILDSRPRPVFPKAMAILNIVAPVLYIPSSAMHCVKTGPLAWDGALTFWVPLGAFAAQLTSESLSLIHAASTEPVVHAPAGQRNGLEGF